MVNCPGKRPPTRAADGNDTNDRKNDINESFSVPKGHVSIFVLIVWSLVNRTSSLPSCGGIDSGGGCGGIVEIDSTAIGGNFTYLNCICNKSFATTFSKCLKCIPSPLKVLVPVVVLDDGSVVDVTVGNGSIHPLVVMQNLLFP